MATTSLTLLLGLAAAMLCLCEAKKLSFTPQEKQLYEKNKGKCDFFLHPDGSDENYGTSYDSPRKSLVCALNPSCFPDLESGDVICLLAGTYFLSETVMSHLRPESKVAIRALGEDYSAILDGKEEVQIFNALQSSITFHGIVFQNGHSTGSGGAVYGERELHFTNCKFINNKAGVHGGAIMGSRKASFKNCLFQENTSQFAGAVRVNDIGSATFDDCVFLWNVGEKRGGAVITQIETPETQSVALTNCLFCMNESPMSPHIYNYRTATHTCKNCKFNSKECCNLHGRVVDKADAVNFTVPEDSDRAFVCECEDGYEGERCERKKSGGSGKEEL